MSRKRDDGAEALTPRGLQRRVKRHVLSTSHDFFAITVPGFEQELWSEVEQLPGAVPKGTVRGGVEYSGPIDLMYFSNLHLRTAHRVLLRIDEFLAQSYPMLFDRIRRIRWERYLGFSDDFSLSISAKASRLKHNTKIAATIEQAIQSSLQSLGQHAKHVSASSIAFHIRFFRDRCTVSLDTSGAHLHQRAYRRYLGRAPIRETLASAILLRSNLDDYSKIVDPFCGSGTLIIEAAQILSKRPPGIGRQFGFETLPFHNPRKWDRIGHESLMQIRNPRQSLIGSDINATVIVGAQENARLAEVDQYCTFVPRPAQEIAPPDGEERGILVSNLPYGQRIAVPDDLIFQFFAHIRATHIGWDFAFVIRDQSLLVSSGLRPRSSTKFLNGGLLVELVNGSIPQ